MSGVTLFYKRKLKQTFLKYESSEKLEWGKMTTNRVLGYSNEEDVWNKVGQQLFPDFNSN